MYKKIFRPLFFRLDPEQVHTMTVQLMRLVGAVPPLGKIVRKMYISHSHKDIAVEVMGLKFTNPIGLAAGYDKDALAWQGLSTLGFGHIEVGTVTLRPQDGNPKPRVFRIPEEEAVINRMGFPGRGADLVAQRLSANHNRPSTLIIGVNIGKNKNTPNQEAAKDYVNLLEKFSPLADYLAVNISSPNTVGLRRLQARDQLENLLSHLAEKRATLPIIRPILVKLAPDLNDDELDDALAAIMSTGMDGVIATNTTIGRETLQSPIGRETGGLSGNPLTAKSRNMTERISQKTLGQLPIVGVGGIMNPDDAKILLDSGASLIQLYTGLIYEGPGLVKNIVRVL